MLKVKFHFLQTPVFLKSHFPTPSDTFSFPTFWELFIKKLSSGNLALVICPGVGLPSQAGSAPMSFASFCPVLRDWHQAPGAQGLAGGGDLAEAGWLARARLVDSQVLFPPVSLSLWLTNVTKDVFVYLWSTVENFCYGKISNITERKDHSVISPSPMLSNHYNFGIFVFSVSLFDEIL